MFCHALQGQFARVRSFAFIDTVDEVTHLFEEGDFSDAMRRLTSEADLVWLDGHSDYGHAFERFHAGWAEHDHPPHDGPGARRRAQQLPRGQRLGARRPARGARAGCTGSTPSRAPTWDSGDSIVREYARHCDDMVECRTLRQLADVRRADRLKTGGRLGAVQPHEARATRDVLATRRCLVLAAVHLGARTAASSRRGVVAFTMELSMCGRGCCPEPSACGRGYRGVATFSMRYRPDSSWVIRQPRWWMPWWHDQHTNTRLAMTVRPCLER